MKNKRVKEILLFQSQSPSSSYLFSHWKEVAEMTLDVKCKAGNVAIALKLLPVFTQRHSFTELWFLFGCGKVAIALKLLPVFTQLLFLMQKTCAFLNPKILTSPILRPA